MPSFISDVFGSNAGYSSAARTYSVESKYRYITHSSYKVTHHMHYESRQEITNLLYNEAWWCCANPVTCGGIACVPCCTGSMLVESVKCCCFHGICQTDGCWSDMGMCADLNKCCCCVTHFSCPPPAGPNRGGRGMPTFACCDYRCCEGVTSGYYTLMEDAELLQKTFLCCYCFCSGVGFTDCNDPFVKKITKCCCFSAHCVTEEACPSDGDCAFSNTKCCCKITALTFPSLGGEKDGIPQCACCGKIGFGPPAPQPEISGFKPPIQYNIHSPRHKAYVPGCSPLGSPKGSPRSSPRR